MYSKNDNKHSQARFELDYLFAKSTMYQKPLVYFEEYPWYHPGRWAQWLYNVTMGLGYRPFRLAWWVLGLTLIFAIYYQLRMAAKINRYLSKDERKESTVTKRGKRRIGQKSGNLPFTDTAINCL